MNNRKENWKRKGEEWMKIPFSCLRRVCLFFTLADCTYLLYIVYVMYLEEVILVKFSSLIFYPLVSSPLLSSGYISSMSSMGGTRSVCLF